MISAVSSINRVLTLAGCWKDSVLHGTNQIVLQQTDFHASPAAMFRHGSIRAGHWRISHAHHINPVDRNLVAQHQIPHHRVRHLLRTGNGSLTAARSKSEYFDDVAAIGRAHV